METPLFSRSDPLPLWLPPRTRMARILEQLGGRGLSALKRIELHKQLQETLEQLATTPEGWNIVPRWDVLFQGLLEPSLEPLQALAPPDRMEACPTLCQLVGEALATWGYTPQLLLLSQGWLWRLRLGSQEALQLCWQAQGQFSDELRKAQLSLSRRYAGLALPGLQTPEEAQAYLLSLTSLES